MTPFKGHSRTHRIYLWDKAGYRLSELEMGMRLIAKGNKQILGRERNNPYLDCGSGHIGVYIFPTHQTVQLKYVW